MDEVYTFPLSGLRVGVDLTEGNYCLGEPQDQQGMAVWPEVGPLPTEQLPHYSAQPESHPGWVFAIGAVGPAEEISGIYGAAVDVADPAVIEQWDLVNFCVLGERVWIAELRQDQRWLRFDSSVRSEVWQRPDRRTPISRGSTG